MMRRNLAPALALALLAALCGDASALVCASRFSPLAASRVVAARQAPFARCAVACKEEDADAKGKKDAAADAAPAPQDDAAAPEGADAEDAADSAEDLLTSPAFLKKKVQVLEDELAKLSAEKEALVKRLEEEEKSPQVLRLQADFENLRRRTAEQSLETKELARVDCIKELLPVMDNFDRAAGLKTASEEAEKIKNSYQQLYKQLLDVVTKNLGAVEIDAVGKEFDFNFHEAIVRGESTEVPENHVIDVFQRGYTVGERLVRPAGVRVSMGPGPDGGAEEKAKGNEAKEAQEE